MTAVPACKRSSGFIFDFRSSVLAVAPEANDKWRTSSTALQLRYVKQLYIHKEIVILRLHAHHHYSAANVYKTSGLSLSL